MRFLLLIGFVFVFFYISNFSIPTIGVFLLLWMAILLSETPIANNIMLVGSRGFGGWQGCHAQCNVKLHPWGLKNFYIKHRKGVTSYGD